MESKKQLGIGFIFGAVSTVILIHFLEKYDPFGLPFPFGKKENNDVKNNNDAKNNNVKIWIDLKNDLTEKQ
jgi:hypothetical protein